MVYRRHADPKFLWLNPVFEIYPHLDEFLSADLFIHCKDEDFEHLWEFEGRVDDIIILGSGPKVNPLADRKYGVGSFGVERVLDVW